jgi:L-alanine-DL-glutamate epimerase-like enolase superfamily enzyme
LIKITIIALYSRTFQSEQVEIRVDANGAFDENEALIKLTQLSEFKLHSIEQLQKSY